MAGDIKLRLYAQGDIDLQDPNDQNSDLASKYNIGLFDMAYLLAISLNEEFLPPNLKKSYFGYRKDLTKSKKLLEKTKSELPRKPFYSRLIDLIDEYLQDINIGLA